MDIVCWIDNQTMTSWSAVMWPTIGHTFYFRDDRASISATKSIRSRSSIRLALSTMYFSSECRRADDHSFIISDSRSMSGRSRSSAYVLWWSTDDETRVDRVSSPITSTRLDSVEGILTMSGFVGTGFVGTWSDLRRPFFLIVFRLTTLETSD